MISEEEFEATVSSTEAGSVIEMKGVVNRLAKERMEIAFAEASQHSGEIRLNFTDVDYINSTGIAVIVGILATARAESREVGAFGLSDHYREVFRITRLSDFIKIYDNVPNSG